MSYSFILDGRESNRLKLNLQILICWSLHVDNYTLMRFKNYWDQMYIYPSFSAAKQTQLASLTVAPKILYSYTFNFLNPPGKPC